MKVALVHDWLTGMRGGERCLDEFLKLYPNADVYTLVHEPGTTNERIDARVRGTSILQKFPLLRKRYRLFLPFFPLIARSLVVKDYDLVISLSHAAAKNVRMENVGKHICYCFTPMRYIWDMAPHYLGKWALVVSWPLISLLRRWDKKGAEQVDHFVGISRFVASRIRKYYGRKASVVYPPVRSSDRCASSTQLDSKAFLYAGAYVPYKGVEEIIDVFNELKLPLWCVGSGPLEESLREKAGDNIQFFGSVSDEELQSLYEGCRALVFPAKEDFGIIPIEALLAGRPVIAGYYGATRETIPGWRPWLGETFIPEKHAGVFFQRASREKRVTLLSKAITSFLKVEERFQDKTCVQAGRQFSAARFQSEWKEVFHEQMSGIGAKMFRMKRAESSNSSPEFFRVRARV